MDELLDTFLPHITREALPQPGPCSALTPQHCLMARMDLHPHPCPAAPMGTTIPMDGTGIPSLTEHQLGASPSCRPPMAPHHRASPSGCCRSSGLAGGRGHCPCPLPCRRPGSPPQGASSPGAQHPRAERGGPAAGGSCLTSQGGSGARCPLLGLLCFS